MDNKELEKNNIPENDLPKMANDNNQADFSSIFNVASEEKKEKDTESTPETTPEQVVQVPERPVKKKEVFNGEEKLLYEIQPEKEGNPIVPLLFFLTLIVVIAMLPLISKKYDFKFMNPSPNASHLNEEQPDYYYFNRSTVKATIGDLEFTNFIKSHIYGEYRVSFTMKNNAEKTYQFDKKYYLVLYNEREKIVHRALIHSFEAIGAMGAKTVTLNITKNAFESADRFKIEEIPVSTYPEAQISEKEGEYEVMKCTYNTNTIKYYFIDGELAKIYDVVREDKINSYQTYDNNKLMYKNYSEKYKKINNLSSIFIETDEYYQMVNEFDLKLIPDASLSTLQTYRFFKYKENKDIISFELEAQAYNCS